MSSKLSTAMGVILSALEIAETHTKELQNIRLIHLSDMPTNVIEFSINDTMYEILINEKAATTSSGRGATRTVHGKTGTQPAQSPKEERNRPNRKVSS